MLRDSVRTDTYQRAVMLNPSLFEGKVVLDVGAGTGILSLFAAKCGARKVYAVERSSIAYRAKQIVEKNGYSDIITVLQVDVEDIDIPEKVDVVISEWMGYSLLYESMLPSVIVARNKFMKPDGTMFPNRATMYIAGINVRNTKADQWKNVYGFKMNAIRRLILSEADVDTISPLNVITSSCVIADFDLNKVESSELAFRTPFSLTSLWDKQLYGFIVWFTVTFDGIEHNEVLSTSPYKPSTHWAQTIFSLPEPVHVEDGYRIEGFFDIRPNEQNYRDQDFQITFTANNVSQTNEYKLR